MKDKKNKRTVAKSPASSKKSGKAGYFFGALKKIALFPFAAGSARAAKAPNSGEDPEGWDQIDPFHHRPDIAFS